MKREKLKRRVFLRLNLKMEKFSSCSDKISNSNSNSKLIANVERINNINL
jgi:hypothetical protein